MDTIQETFSGYFNKLYMKDGYLDKKSNSIKETLNIAKSAIKALNLYKFDKYQTKMKKPQEKP